MEGPPPAVHVLSPVPLPTQCPSAEKILQSSVSVVPASVESRDSMEAPPTQPDLAWHPPHLSHPTVVQNPGFQTTSTERVHSRSSHDSSPAADREQTSLTRSWSYTQNPSANKKISWGRKREKGILLRRAEKAMKENGGRKKRRKGWASEKGKEIKLKWRES